MAEEKRTIHHYLDALLDQDGGLKTKLEVTMSQRTSWNLAGVVLLSGIGVAFIASLIKNKQLTEINNNLLEIKKALKK